MKDLVLYHFPGACSRVTMTALEHAGFEYRDQPVNIFKGEQKSPEYLQINPAGRVPSLVVDGRPLVENAAIQLFIHSVKPEAQLLPVSDDPIVRTQVLSDMFWVSGTIHPTVRQTRVPRRYTDGDTAGVQANGEQKLHGIAKRVDEQVQQGGWWYGDTWSIVDVYLRWCFATAASAGFPVADYPALQAHNDRVDQLPSYQRALAREQVSREKLGM